MFRRENVSISVIQWLPCYYHFLTHLKKMGMTRISPRKLSEKMGLTASQVRRNLDCFGGFGQQGHGYIVGQLQREIGGIPGLPNSYKAILIGAGNLGQALALHMAFTTQGFQLVGIFDDSPSKISTGINGIMITDTQRLKGFCEAEQPAMAILCALRESAEKFSEQLYSLGIRSFWNFSHFDISIGYPSTVVESVHLDDSLVTLYCHISDHQEEKDTSDDTTV